MGLLNSLTFGNKEGEPGRNPFSGICAEESSRESEPFIWTMVNSGQQLDVGGWGLGAVASRTLDRKGSGLESWSNRDDRVTSVLAGHRSRPTPSLYVGALSKFLS